MFTMVLYLNTGKNVNLALLIGRLPTADYTDSLLSMIHAVTKYMSTVGII